MKKKSENKPELTSREKAQKIYNFKMALKEVLERNRDEKENIESSKISDQTEAELSEDNTPLPSPHAVRFLKLLAKTGKRN